jgi:hypothetical protein
MQRSLLLALLLTTIAVAPCLSAPAVSTWRADLKLLTSELPKRHPAPFLRISQAQWDSAAASLDRRLPSLSRNQILVGFMQLITLLSDAHTNLEPDSSLGLRFYPLELYAFDDGLFIRGADTAHAALVGAKVLRLGRVSAEQALDRVASVIPHENDQWVRAFS